MGCFVDILFQHSEVVDSLNEKQFLNVPQSTLSLE